MAAKITPETEAGNLKPLASTCEPRARISERFESLVASYSQALGSFDMTDLYEALDVLNSPLNVRESARSIYRRAVTGGLVQDAPSRKALVSAAIYAAYKQNGLLRSLDEIARVAGVDKAVAEQFLSSMLGEIGYLSPRLDTVNALQPDQTIEVLESEMRPETNDAAGAKEQNPHAFEVKFLEKKGAFEFLRLLKENPRRWNTLEKELDLSPRTLSDRITQGLELGLIEKIRRLKIGATYYRLTEKGKKTLEAASESTRIY